MFGNYPLLMASIPKVFFNLTVVLYPLDCHVWQVRSFVTVPTVMSPSTAFQTYKLPAVHPSVIPTTTVPTKVICGSIDLWVTSSDIFPRISIIYILLSLSP